MKSFLLLSIPIASFIGIGVMPRNAGFIALSCMMLILFIQCIYPRMKDHFDHYRIDKISTFFFVMIFIAFTCMLISQIIMNTNKMSFIEFSTFESSIKYILKIIYIVATVFFLIILSLFFNDIAFSFLCLLLIFEMWFYFHDKKRLENILLFFISINFIFIISKLLFQQTLLGGLTNSINNYNLLIHLFGDNDLKLNMKDLLIFKSILGLKDSILSFLIFLLAKDTKKNITNIKKMHFLLYLNFIFLLVLSFNYFEQIKEYLIISYFFSILLLLILLLIRNGLTFSELDNLNNLKIFKIFTLLIIPTIVIINTLIKSNFYDIFISVYGVIIGAFLFKKSSKKINKKELILRSTELVLLLISSLYLFSFMSKTSLFTLILPLFFLLGYDIKQEYDSAEDKRTKSNNFIKMDKS